jgi:hypothetical protein
MELDLHATFFVAFCFSIDSWRALQVLKEALDMADV